MAKDKRKPLRGADIFTDPGTPEKKEAPAKQQSSKASSLSEKPTTPEKKEVMKVQATLAAKREQVTVYLDPALNEDLERAHFEIRRLTKKKLSKSDLINCALEEILKEFSSKKEASRLVKNLQA